MQSDLFFQRKFTPLPGLQEGRVLRYALECIPLMHGVGYGICVTESTETGDASESTGAFTRSAAKAKTILLYLYENAVSPVHCVSVVSDLCTDEDETKWEGACGSYSNPSSHCG